MDDGRISFDALDEGYAAIEDALKAWLKVLGATNDVLSLLEEMVADERLLLLVDGLDEWQNREAAVAALTALTTYVQTRHLPLVATSRPLGFERISDFGPEWKHANLLPLTSAQQRDFATYCGAAGCVGTANGTDAIYLALRGLGGEDCNPLTGTPGVGPSASSGLTLGFGVVPLRGTSAVAQPHFRR